MKEPAFKEGDRVVLKKQNPFKGTLKAAGVYVVSEFHDYANRDPILVLTASNQTLGAFHAKWFKKLDYDLSAADEYEDAIKAQEIMEQS